MTMKEIEDVINELEDRMVQVELSVANSLSENNKWMRSTITKMIGALVILILLAGGYVFFLE